MADPLSTAAGCIALASTGIKLASSLHEYTKSVRETERLLQPIADHIQLTTSVLRSVGSLFEREETKKICTDELLRSTSAALDGCKTAFRNLDDYVQTHFKKNSMGRLSTSSRALFSFRQKELDVFQAHLERFKSSLDLILGVLTLAFSAKTAKDNAALLDMKLEIQTLMMAEQEAKLRETQLATDSQVRAEEMQAGLPTHRTDGTGSVRFEAPTMSTSTVRGHENGSARQPDTTLDVDIPILQDLSLIGGALPPSSHNQDLLLQHLDDCSKAVTKLASAVNASLAQWQHNHKYEPADLPAAYDSTRIALHELSQYAICLGLETDSPLPRMTQAPSSDRPVTPGNIQIGQGIQSARMSRSRRKSCVGLTLIGVGFVIASIATCGLFPLWYFFYNRRRKQSRPLAAQPTQMTTTSHMNNDAQPAGAHMYPSSHDFSGPEIDVTSNRVYELNATAAETGIEHSDAAVDALIRKWTGMEFSVVALSGANPNNRLDVNMPETRSNRINTATQ